MDGAFRAKLLAAKAAYAFFAVDFRKLIFDLDGVRRADVFTFATADTFFLYYERTARERSRRHELEQLAVNPPVLYAVLGDQLKIRYHKPLELAMHGELVNAIGNKAALAGGMKRGHLV